MIPVGAFGYGLLAGAMLLLVDGNASWAFWVLDLSAMAIFAGLVVAKLVRSE